MLHPIFVSLSMDGVLGARGGRNFTDVQQGVEIVRLVSRGLLFRQP